MNVAVLRAIDRWLGIPGCLLLTLHRRLLRAVVPDEPVRRILFVKLAEQGSTVLAAAALRRAIDRVGRENVYFLAFEQNRLVLDAMNLIPRENVLTLNADRPLAAIRSGLSLLARLRSVRAHAAVDLEFFARSSAIFAYLSGAGRRVGLHAYTGAGPYRGDLFTHRLVFNPYLHTSQLFLLAVEALDQPGDRFPACPVTPPDESGDAIAVEPAAADLSAVRALIGECTGRPGVPPIVLLNANCSDMLPLRRWDPDRYVELAGRLLAARPDLFVLFTGGPEEAAATGQLAAQVRSARCASVAGKTTFGQLLALYSLARVLVTNDSGPAHFASLTGIDVVTLFGPETPRLFAACTPRSHVIWSGIVCSPCVSALNNRLSSCRENACMRLISVDEVFDTTMRVFAARELTGIGSGTTSPRALSSTGPAAS